MAAHPKDNRTLKEIEADEARRAWWTKERRTSKSEWRKQQNQSDELRQKISNGCKHCKRSNKIR